jgi:hypothetical protein
VNILSFVISKEILSNISATYTKKDYDREGVKTSLANDFFVEVNGRKVTFSTIDLGVLCYTVIQTDLSGEDYEQFSHSFSDGIIPFDSVEVFGNIVKLLSKAKFIRMKLDPKTEDVVFDTFGDNGKHIDYDSAHIQEIRSYNLTLNGRKFFKSTAPIPQVFTKDENGEPGEGFELGSKIVVSAKDLQEAVSNSSFFDTREYLLKVDSEKTATLETRNTGKKENVPKRMIYNIPLSSENFVPVERYIGFGFSHVVPKISGDVEIFYNETDDMPVILLRNTNKSFTIHSIINFNTTSEAEQTAGDEEFFDVAAETDIEEGEDEEEDFFDEEE